MRETGGSIRFVRWTARIVAALGLGFVFVPLVWNWSGEPRSETIELYITGVGVPLLTFAGFLAVYLGFLSQERQNAQQEEHFQKDRFESTFFQLLRTHNQIVSDIRHSYKRQKPPPYGSKGEWEEFGTVQLRGRSCFERFYTELENQLEKTALEKNWTNSDEHAPAHMSLAYEEWFEDRKPKLNHYFNNLSKIISFVHRSDVEEKQFYIDLVIAQMSVPELVLFFYHEGAMRERKQYVRGIYDLLDEYTFFEQIAPQRSLIHQQHSNIHEEALGEW